MKRILVFSILVLLAVVVLRAQNLSDDEIKLDSRPYTPPPEIAIRKQANLVELRVVVRDAKGQPVPGLQQSDFELLDNGKPQVISAFSVETVAPRSAAPTAPAGAASTENPAPPPSTASPTRYVALFFDDLSMPVRDLVPTRKAGQSFVISHLEPGDHVGIFTSSTTVTLPFTDDRKKLLDSLAALRPRLRRPGNGVTCPRIGLYQAYQIDKLHDPSAIELGMELGVAEQCFVPAKPPNPPSPPLEIQAAIVKNIASQTLSDVEQFSRNSMSVLKSVIEYLGKMPGSRSLLLSSSGFLTMTTHLRYERDKLVDIALRNGVIINSLDANGLVPNAASGAVDDGPPVSLGMRLDLQSELDRNASEQRALMSDPLAILAEGTGGRFFHNNNDLNAGLRQLAAAPGVSYLLGFAPSGLRYDGTYHDLKVKLVNSAGYRIEARRGYTAPDRPPLPPSGFSVRFENEVMASGTLSELAVNVATESARLPTGESGLHVVLRFDTKSLPFQRRSDRNAENLRFIIALFDAQGKFLAATDNAMDLLLKDDSLARVTEQGLEQRFTLQAPPGAYKLRVVLEELMNGKMAALTRPVQIQ